MRRNWFGNLIRPGGKEAREADAAGGGDEAPRSAARMTQLPTKLACDARPEYARAGPAAAAGRPRPAPDTQLAHT